MKEAKFSMPQMNQKHPWMAGTVCISHGSNPPFNVWASARGSAMNEPLETGAGLEMVDGLRPFICRQEQRGAGD